MLCAGPRLRLAFLWGLALPSFCAKQPIVETDLLKIGRVTEVQITPDAARAIFGVQTIHSEPSSNSADAAYSYRVNLWIVDLRDSSSKPIQLTFGDRNDSGLAISPDGRELAFVRPDAKKHPQVWLLSLLTPGEPRMVSDLENGAFAPHWRNDSKAILVTSSIPVSKLPGKPTFDLERPARDWWDFDRPDTNAKMDAAKGQGSPDGDIRAIRDWLEHNAEQKDADDITRIGFLGETSLSGELAFAELFRIDISPEPKGTQLTFTFRDHNNAVYSPSGDRILFAGQPESHEHPDRLQGKSAIWQVTPNGLNEQMILSQPDYSFDRPLFTPDAKHLIFLGQRNDQPTFRQTMVGKSNPDGTALTWLTDEGDPGVQQLQVNRDGRVYFTVNYRGGEPLLWLDALRPRKSQSLVDIPAGVTAFAVCGEKIVYAQVSADNPNELYVMNRPPVSTRASHEPARRLTDINAAWLENRQISLPEEHWVTRTDGTRVQYWVMKPTNTGPAGLYPWVLDMHGGPSAMWGPGEFSMWHEFQMFCSFGYGVIYGNPRGSSGYGYSFQHANYKDWGDGPAGDVMATVDDALAHYQMIDKERLFITGGSYAGYLTAWIVGHTDRFKAAAALRGVYDLATFFGEGNAYRLVPEEFGGYPWEPETRRLLDQQSPISFVTSIKTPLLIIHGSSDNRTGVVQGQMLFRALKQLNRPVEYVRYPNAGHEITRSGPPLQRMDHMLRIIEFFERYAQNTRTVLKPLSSPVQGVKTGVQ